MLAAVIEDDAAVVVENVEVEVNDAGEPRVIEPET